VAWFKGGPGWRAASTNGMPDSKRPLLQSVKGLGKYLTLDLQPETKRQSCQFTRHHRFVNVIGDASDTTGAPDFTAAPVGRDPGPIVGKPTP
jgi:hypothetical protein